MKIQKVGCKLMTVKDVLDLGIGILLFSQIIFGLLHIMSRL